MKHSFRLALAVLVGGIAVVVTHADPPEPGFWLVGFQPGSLSAVTSLTIDGGMAAGGQPSFTWTRDGGRNDFGLFPGTPPVNYATGLSDNGIAVGYVWTGGFSDTSRAYRWTGSGPLEDLGLLPGWATSEASSISGDGGVIAGTVRNGETAQAMRWTPSGGMQGLGWLPGSNYSAAHGVSRDGSTIVGGNIDGALQFKAFTWREDEGMKALPNLPNAPLEASALAASADGSAIVGTSDSPNGKSHAVRWIDGTVEDLVSGPYSGFHSSAYATSDDGSIIGGSIQMGGSADFEAFVWNASMGMVELDNYLVSFGINVPANYKLNHVFAMSGDGLTFGGQARNLLTNQFEGFVATIPEDSACLPDCDASGQLNIDDFICFQTFFALGELKADCDASGTLNIDDFICFQTGFSLGC
jgi:probable HAF family extracellular repeat protein